MLTLLDTEAILDSRKTTIWVKYRTKRLVLQGTVYIMSCIYGYNKSLNNTNKTSIKVCVRVEHQV